MFRKILIAFLFVITIISGTLIVLNCLNYLECQDSYDEVREKATNTSSIDFDKLEAINDEVIGWIKIKGTKIDYPIVKTKDNEKYLTTLFNKQPGSSGAIFADYRYGAFDSFLTLIYGHRMKDGSMFNNLKLYKDKAWAEKHKNIKVYTKDKDYKFEIVAFSLVDAADVVYQFNESDDLSKESFIQSIKSNALYTMADADITDKLVVLSTCTYEFENARYILVGKLV